MEAHVLVARGSPFPASNTAWVATLSVLCLCGCVLRCAVGCSLVLCVVLLQAYRLWRPSLSCGTWCLSRVVLGNASVCFVSLCACVFPCACCMCVAVHVGMYGVLGRVWLLYTVFGCGLSIRGDDACFPPHTPFSTGAHVACAPSPGAGFWVVSSVMSYLGLCC